MNQPLFEGVCLDSRHPGPRRVWQGGPDQRSMDHFTGTVPTIPTIPTVPPVPWRLDFAGRRSTSEHLAPPEVALVAGEALWRPQGLKIRGNH